MARVRVLTTKKRLTGPITFWVHRPTDNEVWAKATRFDPPLPPEGPDGYPHYVVEHLGHEVWFASLAEVLHAEEVLSREPLPSGSELARESQRRTLRVGDHGHARHDTHVRPWHIQHFYLYNKALLDFSVTGKHHIVDYLAVFLVRPRVGFQIIVRQDNERNAAEVLFRQTV
jgi:hypothetical protein